MSAAKIGSFDDLLQITNERLRPIARVLRKTIFDLHPEVFEVVRLGERSATYGLGPRKMIEGYAYIIPHSAWVNLGFFQGAALPDRERLLTGTGARMQHVRIQSLEDASCESVRSLLRDAVVERKAALGTSGNPA